MDLQEMRRDMEVTDVTRNRDSWWAFVNEVMNFRVPQDAGNFVSS